MRERVDVEAQVVPMLKPRPHRHGCWCRHGTGYLWEARWLGIWLYRATEFQHWSPLFTEITQHRGIRIGHVRIGWSWSTKHFKDGKDPAFVKGSYLT